MARIRTVKPELFRHEGLFEAEKDSGLPLRLAFIGLFTVCDREGRFPWKPRALKLDVLPFDTSDFSAVLDALQKNKFLFKYEDEGKEYGFIPSWLKHQVINTREAKSTIAPPPDNYMDLHMHAHAHIADTSRLSLGCNVPGPVRETVFARDGHQCVRCGSMDDLTIDHIFPQSLGGSHAITNLRTLCRPCNSARPVQGTELIEDLAKDGLSLDDMQRMCMHVQEEGEGKGREGKGTGKGRTRDSSFDQFFEKFWKIYPNKVGKPKAMAKLKQINPDGKLDEAIMEGLARHCVSQGWLKDNGEFIPHPTTWLNRNGWEDEVKPYAPGQTIGQGNRSGSLSAVDRVRAANDAAEARRRAQGSTVEVTGHLQEAPPIDADWERELERINPADGKIVGDDGGPVRS